MSPPALAGMSARVEQQLIHHLKTRGNESDSDCCFCFSVFYSPFLLLMKVCEGHDEAWRTGR